MKIARRIRMTSTIPTASMSDIIFNLLLFFMVTSIFKTEEGLQIQLPRAKSGTEAQQQQLIHIWADRFSRISINDKLVRIEHIQGIIASRLEENRGLIIAFNVDNRTKYKLVSDIMEQLKEANAINVTFTSVYESD
ncbi:MAG: biopolymer transporter ExbD [Candidatus Latescibacterota bacterium]|nr:MAG: biopolymer transporter ExbD [Candidatus Latescibacterota bacterium]